MKAQDDVLKVAGIRGDVVGVTRAQRALSHVLSPLPDSYLLLRVDRFSKRSDDQFLTHLLKRE
jgi:hypothetical protein